MRADRSAGNRHSAITLSLKEVLAMADNQQVISPHPNPLPQGEGTRRTRIKRESQSISISQIVNTTQADFGGRNASVVSRNLVINCGRTGQFDFHQQKTGRNAGQCGGIDCSTVVGGCLFHLLIGTRPQPSGAGFHRGIISQQRGQFAHGFA